MNGVVRGEQQKAVTLGEHEIRVALGGLQKFAVSL
jgi:hypothetical protein